MAKEKNKINPYALCLLACALLVAAWLMRSFPVVIFAALAPLLAISDHAAKDNVWNKLELAGVAVAIAIWAGHLFAAGAVVYSLLQAIAVTLTFVVYAFTRQSLGARLGKLPLLLFWLALEYAFLKLQVASYVIFLADSMQLKTDWFRWTEKTGYLGVSLWILLANLAFYHALLQNGLRLPFLLAFAVIVAAPIVYSYTLSNTAIGRSAMVTFYQGNGGPWPEFYVEKGEWIPRTSAWISVLIILFALVKNNTTKR